jgi:hypothetical protein
MDITGMGQLEKMQEPKDIIHHYSGKLNEEGLSEEWMKVKSITKLLLQS